MAISNYFYHRLTRKYIALFGSLFNKLSIARYDNNFVQIQRMPVPISFAPWQKSLNKIVQDKNFDNKTSAQLPMMTFELDSITYDSIRKGHGQHKIMGNGVGAETYSYTPVPYVLRFHLNIWTANMEDGTQIVEQILPFFQPDYTPSVFLLDNFNSVDVPIVLESVSSEDIYEGNYETRRTIRWLLTFSMNCYYYGPTKQAKVIKFVDIDMHSSMNQSSDVETKITAQPGMDIDGNATTDINDTINYMDINIDDDWAEIVQIIDNPV